MQTSFFCYSCHNKADEFTILLCNHVICSQCLEASLKKMNQISIVQCQCGFKTYCSEESMRLSLKSLQNSKAHCQNDSEQIKLFDNTENTDISNFKFQQSSSNSEKKDPNASEAQSRSKYPFPIEAKSYLRTQPLIIDDSPFLEKDNYSIKDVNGVTNIKSVKSLSPENSPKFSSTISCRPIQQQSHGKSSMHSSTASTDEFSKELSRELRFIKAQYERQVEEVKYCFKRVLKTINKKFEAAMGNAKSFCLQQLLSARNSSELGIGKIIKANYDSKIGRKFNELYFSLQRLLSQEKNNKTDLLIKDLNQKDPNRERKGTKSASSRKSSQKEKGCALYLAIKPKEKHDRLINYIDIVRADVKTGKKGLSKKGIKRPQMRVY